MKLDLGKIKTEGLLQLIVTSLCGFYSSGGLSYNRSISSKLLESAEYLIHQNNYKSLWGPGGDKVPSDDELIAEATKRIKGRDRLIEVSFDKNIYRMKNSAILFLGLKEYGDWIKHLYDGDRAGLENNEQKSNEEHRGMSRWELDMAYTLPKLFRLLNKPPKFSQDEILRETYRRFSTIVKLRHEVRFRNEP
ncbi:MAG: hypothetical protein PHN74_01515 [Candidatus Pacebacteria bacterium]|nr:hypothetical protein [Candidatus Paceibacterota bacterium]